MIYRDMNRATPGPSTVLKTLLMCLMGLALAFLVACAIPGGSGLAGAQLPVQYATLKVIEESDGITAQGVISHVERVRIIVETDASLSPAQIATQLLEAVDVRSLSPSDQLLLQLLITQIQSSIIELNLLEPDQRMTVLQVLGWIEQAARIAV